MFFCFTQISLSVDENGRATGSQVLWNEIRDDLADKARRVGKAETTLYTNSAPSGGACDIDPVVGIALETEFTIKCRDWSDDAEDLPLKYNFLSIAGNCDIF